MLVTCMEEAAFPRGKRPRRLTQGLGEAGNLFALPHRRRDGGIETWVYRAGCGWLTTPQSAQACFAALRRDWLDRDLAGYAQARRAWPQVQEAAQAQGVGAVGQFGEPPVVANCGWRAWWRYAFGGPALPEDERLAGGGKAASSLLFCAPCCTHFAVAGTALRFQTDYGGQTLHWELRREDGRAFAREAAVRWFADYAAKRQQAALLEAKQRLKRELDLAGMPLPAELAGVAGRPPRLTKKTVAAAPTRVIEALFGPPQAQATQAKLDLLFRG